MSDTPETDAFANQLRGLGTGYYEALDFARKLERERDEARKEVERLKWRLNHCAENIGDLVAIRFATGASDAEIDSAMKGDK